MVFLNTQSEPPYIVSFALNEFSTWKEVQVLSDYDSGTSELPCPHERVAQTLRCQIDGSWKTSYPTSGFGWVCLQGDNMLVLVGAKCHRRSLSPLHSEMETRLWAMKIILTHDRLSSV